jgi:hypothetical protein
MIAGEPEAYWPSLVGWFAAAVEWIVAPRGGTCHGYS